MGMLGRDVFVSERLASVRVFCRKSNIEVCLFAVPIGVGVVGSNAVVAIGMCVGSASSSLVCFPTFALQSRSLRFFRRL